MLQYYIYQTKNLVNDKIYIGIHQSSDIDNDSYLGSGTLIKKAISKYGRNNFERTILSSHDTYEQALEEEAKLVDVDFMKRKDTYNLRTGGAPFAAVLSDEYRKKISEAKKKNWQDPEFRDKMYKSMSKAQKEIQSRPEVIEKHRASSKAAWEDPEYREIVVNANLRAWRDPEYREGHLKKIMKNLQNTFITCEQCGGSVTPAVYTKLHKGECWYVKNNKTHLIKQRQNQTE